MLSRLLLVALGTMTIAGVAACGAGSSGNGVDPLASPAPNDPSRPDDDDGGPITAEGGTADGGAGSVDGRTLPDVPFAPFDHAVGSGLKSGLVTGRIYADLAANPDARMKDLAALGVRILRVEIERTTPMTQYKTIYDAAKANGIELMALVSFNSVPGSPNPLAGTRTAFDTAYVPAYIKAIDDVTAALPGLRYVEVWNEPDGYGFGPVATNGGTCVATEGAFRYALLTVRVFETMHERRKKKIATPTIAAFDLSISHDVCSRKSVFDAQPIASHRAAYRPGNGLPDGLPTDIVSIHGYGLQGKAPSDVGYSFQGGTFADAVNEFLASKFADGASAIASAPVWYSEVGYDPQQLGGADPRKRQADALTFAFSTLRKHPQITAAFWYSYRDDEVGGSEEIGLRANSTEAFKAHPSYLAYQAQSVASGDVVGPGGAVDALPASAAAGAKVTVKGWAIDADGKAPRVEIAVDGAVVESVTDGNAAHPQACTLAASARCPSVGFVAEVVAPAARGDHAIAVRATDATGHARILGRGTLTVR